MTDVIKRNDHLEAKLVLTLEIQKECDHAKHMKIQLENKRTFLEQELAKEREVIRVWTNSGKRTHDHLANDNWKEGLGYIEKVEEPKPSKKDKSDAQEKTAKNNKSKSSPLSRPIDFVKPVKETKAKTELDSSSEKTAVNDVKSQKQKNKKVNIGQMSKNQLKQKLKEVSGKDKVKQPK